MAIRISSALMNMGRDDDRLTGLKPDTTLITDVSVLIGGVVVTQSPSFGPLGEGKSFKLYDGLALAAGNPKPWGLLIEPKQPFPGGGASGDQAAGVGFDTLDYARGGLFSAFHRPGNILDVYDDFRNRNLVNVNGTDQNKSCPFVANPTAPWAVGQFVYASTVALEGVAGLLGNVATIATSARIGVVRAVYGGPAEATVLTIELDIDVI